jgi:hypothetical protein
MAKKQEDGGERPKKCRHESLTGALEGARKPRIPPRAGFELRNGGESHQKRGRGKYPKQGEENPGEIWLKADLTSWGYPRKGAEILTKGSHEQPSPGSSARTDSFPLPSLSPPPCDFFGL